MWAERRDEDCLFIVDNLWIPVASQSASECAGRCSALLRCCCTTIFMHRKLFLDSMYRAGRYTCQGCVITGGLQGQAGCGVGLPSSRHLPTLVISVRAYLHATPAARARPWSDPGPWSYSGRSGQRYSSCHVGGSRFLRGGQCLPRDRTCPIEDRREHDIVVEPRLIVSSPRPGTATTGLSYRLPAYPALFRRDGAVICFLGCLECDHDVAPTATGLGRLSHLDVLTRLHCPAAHHHPPTTARLPVCVQQTSETR